MNQLLSFYVYILTFTKIYLLFTLNKKIVSKKAQDAYDEIIKQITENIPEKVTATKSPSGNHYVVALETDKDDKKRSKIYTYKLFKPDENLVFLFFLLR